MVQLQSSQVAKIGFPLDILRDTELVVNMGSKTKSLS